MFNVQSRGQLRFLKLKVYQLMLFRRHGLSTWILLLTRCVGVAILNLGWVACASETELEQEMRQGIQAAKDLFPVWTMRATYYCDPLNKLGSTIAVRQGHNFLEMTVDPKSRMEIVKGLNDEYAFTLSRARGSQKYSLTLVARRDDPDYKVRIGTELSGIYFIMLSTHYIVGWLSWDLVEHPDFEVQSIAIEQENDANFVKCCFSFTPQTVPAGHQKRDFFGYIKFDPHANWAIVEYEVMDSAASIDSLRRRIAYEALEAQLPITTLVTARAFGPKYANDKFTTNVKLLARDESEVSEKEFYLSHYGMKEPNFSRQWFGAWVWYLIVGLGCLLAGRLILRRQQGSV